MPTKKTASSNTKTEISKLNLFEKISRVRQEFLAANIQKSGVNAYAEYKYFELGDIVPKLIELTAKYHLHTIVTFDNEFATLRVIDTDSVTATDHQIKAFDYDEYKSPMVQMTVKGMNAIQALGAVETYQRRYLYMMFLDIIEQDVIDSGKAAEKSTNKAAEVKKANTKKQTKPATPKQRTSAKQNITKADAPMDETMKDSLKRGLKKLRAKDDKYEAWIGKAVAKIKGGLTKAQGEKLLIKIGEKVAE